MKTAIIYDSIYGNTGKVAEEVARVRGEDAKLIHIASARKEDVAEAELIIIGTPTHGGRATAAMQTFIKSLPTDIWLNKKVAVFSTGMPASSVSLFFRMVIKILGYAAAPTLAVLLKMGGLHAGEPAEFMVKDKQGPLIEGELLRAGKWAESLK
ncbi:MAG: flavodoxin domain-containing protein [bacterium]|nr:flavodoxin domain-containing protein [bacterium]